MKKIFISLFALLFLPQFTSAQNYDFYVDKNYIGVEEGTLEKPFRNISTAISFAEKTRPGQRNIFVAEGEYNESITLSDSIKLFGQSKEKTILKINPLSTIDLAGNNIIENLTFSGGISALTIRGNAIINNCAIRDAKKKGIDLPEGNSVVKITNSSIENNGGKGVYVQKGRWILLSNNIINGNKGEGFDIRQNIFGIISKNKITNNTESGIEILTSASDVTIRDNQIINNLANGIANQSYPDMPDLGKINIENNLIKGNGKYGIYCGAPSGGTKTKTFFSESIAVKENMNAENKGKPVSGSCHFERQTNDFLTNITSNIEASVNQKIAKLENFYNKQSEIDNAISLNKATLEQIKERSLLSKMFLGIDKAQLADMETRNTNTLSSLQNLSLDQELNNDFSTYLNKMREEIAASSVEINKSRRLNTIFWLPISLVSLFR